MVTRIQIPIVIQYHLNQLLPTLFDDATVKTFNFRVTTRINSDTPRSARKSTIDNSKPPSFSKVVRRVQKTSQEQLLEEAAEKERKQQAAQEAYQVWLSKKRKTKSRGYSPTNEPKRDLKWYEQKKRMFDPDDLEPKIKYKPQSKPQTRPIAQTQSHKKQPYSGNGPTFDVSFCFYFVTRSDSDTPEVIHFSYRIG